MNTDQIVKMAQDEARFWLIRSGSTDFDDLQQQAAEAMLVAKRTISKRYSKQRRANYLKQAARNRCRWLVWENAAPFTGGMHRPRELRAGVHCVAAEEIALRDQTETPDVTIERRDIRRRLEDHAAALPYGRQVLAGLLREWTTIEIGRRFRISHDKVKSTLAQLRATIATDATLRATLET